MTLLEIISRATELSSQGEHEAAISYYQEWLASSNSEQHLRYVAFFNLGTLFHNQGKIDKALVAYDEALKLNPDFSEASVNFGLALEAKSNITTKKRPLTLLDITNKVQELSSKLQFDAAITCYKEWLSSPIPEEHLRYIALFNLGVLFQNQGKIDEAIISYKEALQLKPDFSQASVNLNLALLAKRTSQEKPETKKEKPNNQQL